MIREIMLKFDKMVQRNYKARGAFLRAFSMGWYLYMASVNKRHSGLSMASGIDNSTTVSGLFCLVSGIVQVGRLCYHEV